MLIEVCKSKIAYATVTEAELHYEGSISIDQHLMNAVNLLPNEKVDVLNINNGNRFTTYVIPAPENSGTICLNGPAARLGLVGDDLIILSYGMMKQEKAVGHQIKSVYLDEHNKIK